MDILVHAHLTPRVIEVLSPTTSVTVQEIVNAIRNWEDDNLSFEQLITAAGKESLGGGVTVGITATLLNAQLMFSGRAVPLEYGKSCTTEDLTGKVLKCSTGLFLTNGIYRGCTLSNFTTTSLASVISVDSETQLTSFRLTGGTRDTWLVGDELRVYENTQCSITGGNLVAVDAAGSEISPVMQSPHVQVVRSSSSSSTLQELSAIQYASFGGGVTLDVINGVAGTAYNIGTIENPSNNLTDAVAIANERGFHTLFINESMTLDAGTDIQDFNIIGRSISDTCVIIDPSAICDHIGLQNCNISGTLDGGTRVRNCLIGAVNYVNGHVLDSFLYGTLVLAGNEDAVFANCGISDPDNIPAIDMGGSGQNVIVTDYSGGIKFRNLTGANKIALQMDGGRVFLEPTISAGFVGITGTGELFDSSTGTVNISTTGLMSKDTIATAVWDESIALHLIAGSSGRSLGIAQFNNFVTIDVAGVAGTSFPIGTETMPVNNIADADTIATSMGINRLHFMSDFTFDNTVNIASYDLYGQGRSNTKFTFQSGCIVAYCATYDAEITGLSLGLTYMYNCLISAYGGSGLAPSDKTVVTEKCVISGEISVPSNYTGTLKVLGCYTGVDTLGISSIVVNTNGADFNLAVRGQSGDLKIINSTHIGSSYSLDFESGSVELDSSVTAGTFVIRGVGLLTNNSTGTTTVNIDGLVNKETVANAVWERDLNTYSSGAAATIQALMFGREVVMDSVTGVSGTDFPTGTRERPVNNLTDALTLCSTRGLVRIMTRTGFTVQAGQSIDGIVIATHGIMGTDIVFETGCSANKATIKNANVSGVITLGNELFIESCSVCNLQNFTGVMNLVTLGQGCELGIGTWANLINCHCGGDPTNEPEINIGTGALTVVGYAGNVKLTNKTGTDRTVANFASGSVSIASSCVAGKIQILGIGEVEKDESGDGCLVDIDAVLANEYIASYVRTLMETVGSELDDLHKLQGLDSANPMTATPTSRTVGDINLTITGDGVTSNTVQRD